MSANLQQFLSGMDTIITRGMAGFNTLCIICLVFNRLILSFVSCIINSMTQDLYMWGEDKNILI